MTEPEPHRMRRRRFLGTAAALGAGALAATTAGRAGADPEPAAIRVPSKLPPGDWPEEPTWSDEFEGDLSKWHTRFWNPTAHNVRFTEKNLAIADGNLEITLSKADRPDHKPQFDAGVVRSKYQVPGDSYTEVRAKMLNPDVHANSAIWMLEESTPDRNPNPEFDLQEFVLKTDGERHLDKVRSNIHLHHRVHDPSNDRDEVLGPELSHVFEEPSLWEEFHLYGLERRQNEINFYIDGGEPYWSYSLEAHSDEEREGIANIPQPVILYVRGVDGGDDINAPEPVDFLVDHVRVYTLNAG